MPLFILALLPLAAGALPGVSSSSSKAIFHAFESTDVFSSTSVTLHTPGAPTFAIATDLGQAYVSVWDGGKGVEKWRWVSPCATCALAVDGARHVEVDPQAPGKVDTFAIQSGDGKCLVLGFSAEGSANTPIWSTTLAGCSELAVGGVGGTYTGIQASDSGNAVALLGYGKDTPDGNLTARAYLLNGQTGKVNWVYDLGTREKAGQGDIAIGRDYVMFINEDSLPDPNSAQLHVLSVDSGALRSEVQVPFFIAGAITDDGRYVAVQNFTHLKGSEPWVMEWDAASSAYTLLHRLALPPDGTEYDLWDIAIGTVGTAPYVALGFISAIPSALLLRVAAFDMANGTLLTDWSAPHNTQLQNNPTIRTDGKYMGLGLWGNNGDAPTAVVLEAGSNAPLFTAVSPGSQFSVDIALEGTTLYLSTAGKHVVSGYSRMPGVHRFQPTSALFPPALAHTHTHMLTPRTHGTLTFFLSLQMRWEQGGMRMAGRSRFKKVAYTFKHSIIL